MALERVDIFDVEFRSADFVDTFHDLDQPASCLKSFVAQEQCLAPFVEDRVFGKWDTVANDGDPSRDRNAFQQNV